MPFCPNCGSETRPGERFCQKCGKPIQQPVPTPLSSQDEVRAIVTARLDAIKNRDSQSIARMVDQSKYTKFDDWPPLRRRESDALTIEAEAFKVLKEFRYDIADWRVDMLGNVALATFTISYMGTIRDQNFNVRSRVSALLVNEGGWRIVHEHWSRFPEMGMHRRGLFRR